MKLNGTQYSRYKKYLKKKQKLLKRNILSNIPKQASGELSIEVMTSVNYLLYDTLCPNNAMLVKMIDTEVASGLIIILF